MFIENIKTIKRKYATKKNIKLLESRDDATNSVDNNQINAVNENNAYKLTTENFKRKQPKILQ